MKPFDLEKALAGEPVTTRNGRPVKIAGYNQELGSLIGWVDDRPKEWDKEGIWNTIFEIGGKNDLFMAENPKAKKEGWVNVYIEKIEYKTRCGKMVIENGYSVSNVFFNLESSDPAASGLCKIEWEEEV